MREIKFRAWKNNTMIQPCYCEIFKDGSHTGGDIWVNSSNCVLMQFTGLLDKNGKEIYEGDIVDLHPDDNDNGWHRVIEWDTAAFHCKQIHGPANHPLHFHKHSPDPYWVVIGNIHENPNLLTQ